MYILIITVKCSFFKLKNKEKQYECDNESKWILKAECVSVHCKE